MQRATRYVLCFKWAHCRLFHFVCAAVQEGQGTIYLHAASKVPFTYEIRKNIDFLAHPHPLPLVGKVTLCPFLNSFNTSSFGVLSSPNLSKRHM